MIGVYRPRKIALSSIEQGLVKTVHCTNCVAMREGSSVLASVALPYEADLLLTIALGILPDIAQDQKTRRRCTAVPVFKRDVIPIPHQVQKALAAFSVIVAWATAADHERDAGRRRSAWLRRRLEPNLEGALVDLGISSGSAPDPRELRHIDDSGHANLDTFLADYRPFTKGLWLHGLQSTGISRFRSSAWLEGLAEVLGDCLLLGDALTDIEEDRSTNTPNPAQTDHGAAKVRHELDASVRKGLLLLSTLDQPWSLIARETVGSGLARQLRKRGAILIHPEISD